MPENFKLKYAESRKEAIPRDWKEPVPEMKGDEKDARIAELERKLVKVQATMFEELNNLLAKAKEEVPNSSSNNKGEMK